MQISEGEAQWGDQAKKRGDGRKPRARCSSSESSDAPGGISIKTIAEWALLGKSGGEWANRILELRATGSDKPVARDDSDSVTRGEGELLINYLRENSRAQDIISGGSILLGSGR